MVVKALFALQKQFHTLMKKVEALVVLPFLKICQFTFLKAGK